MAKKKTIADVLVGSDEVVNLSTTVDITADTTCPFCTQDFRQFVTANGKTRLVCKMCGNEVTPLNDGETESLAAYNK